MKTTRVSALLPSSLVEEVKKTSKLENVTQSLVIKRALKFWFKDKLDRDTKALSKIDFDDLPSEDDWDLLQSPL